MVTGGNRGIGLEICRQLASSGVLVVLTARDEDKGSRAVEELQSSGLPGVIFHQLDVADRSSIARLAEFVKTKFEGQIPKARFLPVARADRVVAAPNAMHTARVRFADGAPEHEVSVGCATTSGGGEELWVSVDGKRAVHARRLRWNFRGNQTVFVDGAPVDVLWDLHGWWFRDPPGCAVVMLRARSALESRLWLEEEAAAPGFALVVQAIKTPP